MPNKCSIFNKSLDDDLIGSGEKSYNKQPIEGLIGSLSGVEIDIWYPLFIDRATNSVGSSPLSAHGVIQNQASGPAMLGIQGFISFAPTFRHWTTNGTMSIDWVLNHYNFPYALYYGVMCWYKKIEPAEGEDPGFISDGNLWIPDGDVFSYERSVAENTIFSAKGIARKPYISTGLYRHYREIYNVLTLHEIKSKNKSIKRSRIHKSIAAYLSTSPFVFDFAIAALNSDTIRGYIETAIASTGGLADIKTCLIDISKYLKNKNLDDKENQQTLTGNYIKSDNDLYNKCINKYGAKLVLANNRFLEYNKSLPNGSNLDCSEIKDFYVPNSTVNSTILINQKIDTGYLKVESDLTATNSSLKFYGGNAEGDNVVNIPLADLAKPYISSLEFQITMENNYDDTTFFMIKDEVPSFNVNDHKYYIVADSKTGGAIEEDIVIGLSAFISEPLDFTFKDKINFNSSKLFSFNWEILSGCTNFTGSYVPGAGYSNQGNTSTDPTPSISIYRVGPIKIRLTVDTPFGKVTKSKTINVVSAGQGAADKFTNVRNKPKITAPEKDKFLDSEGNAVEPAEPNEYESTPSSMSSNGNKVLTCDMTRYAFSDNGVFWPIYTNMHVSTASAGFQQDVSQLFKNYKFHVPNTNKEAASKYRISFTTNNNAVVVISSIILNCTRSANPDYSDCLSVCKVRMAQANPGQFYYTDTHKGGYSFNQITGELGNNDIDTGEIIAIESGYISTINAPLLKAYGGYSAAQKNINGIPDLPSHPDPGENVQEGVVNNFETLNVVDDDTTTNDGEGYKICYQKAVQHGASINFQKGVFDPTRGWIIGDNSNRSAVLKFKPGSRETISFTGPGLSQFEARYSDDNENIEPITYKSTILLKLSDLTRPDPYETPCNSTPGADAKFQKFRHELRENITRRAADQITNRTSHGYRILSGGTIKRSEDDVGANSVNYYQCDEFEFEPRASSNDPDSCGSNNNVAIQKVFEYSLVQLGSEGNNPLNGIPAGIDINTPEKYDQYVAESGTPKSAIYDNRYIDAKIDDIEVKLNLFNILNTKDFAFKLVVHFDGITADKFGPPEAGTSSDPRPSAPVSLRMNKFLDSTTSALNAYNYVGSKAEGAPFKGTNLKPAIKNELSSGNGLGDYCAALVDLNSLPVYSEAVLYLMNQEHINSNEFHSSFTFSDHASKNHVLYNHNMYNPYGVNINQKLVKDSTQKILPTVSADGYSESDHIFYRNLLMNNNITIGNNTFSKFNNFGFFQREDDCTLYYDDKITFTLEVEVLDEPDLMGAFDNTKDGAYIAGFYSVDNQPVSDSVFNSICNWDLIIHTDPTPKMASHTTSSIQSMNNSDTLSLIDYGRYPVFKGYNFIANFNGAKSLIPTVNMDAPNTFINDLTLCNSSSNYEAFGRQGVAPLRDFPSAAIISIMIAYAGVATANSLVGVLSFLGNTGFAYADIVNWLSSIRQKEVKERIDRNIYCMDYSKYYPGSAEKALINVSKDGGIWYKLEASIFKLGNTPGLPNNRYDFVLMEKGAFPLFTDIEFGPISSVKDLIDDAFIKEIYIPDIVDDGTFDINTAAPDNVGTKEYDNGVKLSVGDLVQVNSNIDKYSGLYVVKAEDEFVLIEPSNIVNLSSYGDLVKIEAIHQCKRYISINSVFGLNRDIFAGLRSNIESGKIIVIDNEYCFNMFSVGDTIEAHNGDNGTACHIVDKGKIVKDKIIKTVLVLDKNINSYTYVSPYFIENNNSEYIPPVGLHKAIVFKANTTVSHDKSVAFNRWSLEKTGMPQTYPHIEHSAIGKGGFGDGSLNVNKDILTNSLRFNKVNNLNDILNNHESDRVKYNSATFREVSSGSSGSEGPIIVSSVGSIYGFKVSYDDYRDTFSNNITFSESIPEDEQSDFLSRLNIADPNKSNYSMMIMCFDPGSPMSTGVGTVTIDQDFEYKHVRSISAEDMATIKTRIETLEDSVIPSLESTYLTTSADPIECHFPSDTNIACPKKQAEANLNAAYHERANLIEIKQSADINTNILGATEITIETNDDGSITIKEEDTGNDYYWINIDSEQFCSVADEMTPKVLIKTYVECLTPINAGLVVKIPIAIDNNICPAFADGNVGRETPQTESLKADILDFTYEFTDEEVERKKAEIQAQFASIKGWRKDQRTRVIYSSGGSLDSRTNFVSSVAIITEDYWVAIPLEETITENWHTTEGLVNDYTIDIDPNVNFNDEDIMEGIGSEGEGGIPATPPPPSKPIGYLDGSGTRRTSPGKVGNIFNLDNTSNLKVSFRKIPRMLRGKDRSGQVQRLDDFGNRYPSPEPQRGFGGDVSLSSLAPEDLDITSGDALLNDLYAWHCFRKDKDGTLKSENVPDYFKLLNEIELRAFYGSTDGLEISDIDIIEALNPDERIPYEFGGDPPL